MAMDNAIAYISFLYRNFKRYCDNCLEPYELTNGLYFYLIYINRYPGCSLADLTSVMQVDKAYVTRTVNRLCELDYIRKEKSKKDSRACCLYMLTAGMDILEEIRNLFTSWNQELLEGFTEEEMDTFTELLHRAVMIKKS